MAGHIDKIKTPEQLWKDFEEFVKYKKRHPFLQHEFVGKDGTPDYRKKERPLTMQGFKSYCARCCGISGSAIEDYMRNRDGRYDDYIEVCDRIKNELAEDQIEGGLVGVYNAPLIKIINGLVDKSQVETKTEQPLFPENNDVRKDNGGQ